MERQLFPNFITHYYNNIRNSKEKGLYWSLEERGSKRKREDNRNVG
jgi:hypothetical protein